MTDDSELLRRYAKDGSQEAFAELVRRRLPLVYATAAGRLGPHREMAGDVAQAVFLSLARKAASIGSRPSIAGWLYTATRYAATDMLRAERRRKAREEEAMNDKSVGGSADADWKTVRPELLEGIDRLPGRERDVVLLRFFEERPYSEIGSLLRISENSARKRVDRALERLRIKLQRRGIVSTAAALATSVSKATAMAAPPGLETAIVAGAVAGCGGAASVAMVFMTTTQSALTSSSFVALAAIIGFIFGGFALDDIRALNRTRALTAEVGASSKEAQLRLAAQVRPTGIRPAESHPTSEGPEAVWQKFVGLHPEAASMMREALRAEFERSYRGFFLREGLSRATIDEFERRTLDFEMLSVGMGARGIEPWPANMQLPDDQLAAVLGDQGMQDLKRYLRVGFANLYAIQLATACGYAASPLSGEQEVQVAQLIADNSPPYIAGRGVDYPSEVDWTAVESEAKAFLSEDQLKASQTVLLNQQWIQALARAKQSGVAQRDKPASGPETR